MRMWARKGSNMTSSPRCALVSGAAQLCLIASSGTTTEQLVPGYDVFTQTMRSADFARAERQQEQQTKREERDKRKRTRLRLVYVF